MPRGRWHGHLGAQNKEHELAREFRRVVTYDEVPLIVRQTIRAAEDKRVFVHSGVDDRALPRVVQKMALRSLGEWWKGGHGLRLLLPQGGSTFTQQLVRGYFLQDLTSRSGGDALFHAGLGRLRLLSAVLGSSATNKLLRRMEEVRLTLWLEQEMRRRYGLQEQASARSSPYALAEPHVIDRVTELCGTWTAGSRSRVGHRPRHGGRQHGLGFSCARSPAPGRPGCRRPEGALGWRRFRALSAVRDSSRPGMRAAEHARDGSLARASQDSIGSREPWWNIGGQRPEK